MKNVVVVVVVVVVLSLQLFPCESTVSFKCKISLKTLRYIIVNYVRLFKQ